MGRMQEDLRREVARLGECFAVLHNSLSRPLTCSFPQDGAMQSR